MQYEEIFINVTADFKQYTVIKNKLNIMNSSHVVLRNYLREIDTQVVKL